MDISEVDAKVVFGDKSETPGIKKEIDKLGRMVVPTEIRRLYGIQKEVELVLTEQGVLLRSPLYHLEKNDKIE